MEHIIFSMWVPLNVGDGPNCDPDTTHNRRGRGLQYLTD